MQVWEIDDRDLDVEACRNLINSDCTLGLSSERLSLLQTRRQQLEDRALNGGTAYYGINTGFGALCNVTIAKDQLNNLQSNLLRSHACGFGQPASTEVVRLALLLKIFTLSRGHSGVRPALVEFLVELYNHKLIPYVPSMGSLGASGDLAPLAHLFLPCIGEGHFDHNGNRVAASDMLARAGLKPPMLEAKEGLALLNGTQFSLALLLVNLFAAIRYFDIANLNAALSMEAFNCSPAFLTAEIHLLRRQEGQCAAAAQIRTWLEESDLATRPGKSIQDPYSFRCAPQVHGACMDLINWATNIASREINAITDNPIQLHNGDMVSGGNFHAEPLAFASDSLAMALSELANISERRLYQLICGNRGLPDFLTKDPGLSSGYMIVQYAAAAAVSMNKQLSSPSSVDSIVSSKGQEDHVSMAANAGLRCRQVAENTGIVLAMEWMTAARALLLGAPRPLGPALANVHTAYQAKFPLVSEDHSPAERYLPTLRFLENQLFPDSSR
jgi:histidine ammonia-lyase